MTFYSNCLFYAIHKMIIERKGYFLIRKSREGWYPHFLWMSEDLVVHHFQPTDRKIYKYCPPLIFLGYVKIGDKKEQITTDKNHE